MLPSTKILIGIAVMITASLLLGVSPFWLAKVQSEGVSDGATDDEIQHFSDRFMVMQCGVAALFALGFVAFLVGTYSAARMIERTYFNAKPIDTSPAPRVNS